MKNKVLNNEMDKYKVLLLTCDGLKSKEAFWVRENHTFWYIDPLFVRLYSGHIGRMAAGWLPRLSFLRWKCLLIKEVRW